MRATNKFNNSIFRNILAFLPADEYPQQVFPGSMEWLHTYTIIREHDADAAEEAWNKLDRELLTRLKQCVINHHHGIVITRDMRELAQMLATAEGLLSKSNPQQVSGLIKLHLQALQLILDAWQNPAQNHIEYFTQLACMPGSIAFATCGLYFSHALDPRKIHDLLHNSHDTGLFTEDTTNLYTILLELTPGLTRAAMDDMFYKAYRSMKINSPWNNNFSANDAAQLIAVIPSIPPDILLSYIPWFISFLDNTYFNQRETLCQIMLEICVYHPELINLQRMFVPLNFPCLLKIIIVKARTGQHTHINQILNLPLPAAFFNYLNNKITNNLHHNLPIYIQPTVLYIINKQNIGLFHFTNPIVTQIITNINRYNIYLPVLASFNHQSSLLSIILQANPSLNRDYALIAENIKIELWPNFMKFLIEMSATDNNAVQYAENIFLPMIADVQQQPIKDAIFAALTLCVAKYMPSVFNVNCDMQQVIGKLINDLTYCETDFINVFDIFYKFHKNIFDTDMVHFLAQTAIPDLVKLHNCAYMQFIGFSVLILQKLPQGKEYINLDIIEEYLSDIIDYYHLVIYTYRTDTLLRDKQLNFCLDYLITNSSKPDIVLIERSIIYMHEQHNTLQHLAINTITELNCDLSSMSIIPKYENTVYFHCIKSAMFAHNHATSNDTKDIDDTIVAARNTCN